MHERNVETGLWRFASANGSSTIAIASSLRSAAGGLALVTPSERSVGYTHEFYPMAERVNVEREHSADNARLQKSANKRQDTQIRKLQGRSGCCARLRAHLRATSHELRRRTDRMIPRAFSEFMTLTGTVGSEDGVLVRAARFL